MNPLPPDQWDPSLRHVLDDMKGKPINVHSLMANHPDLLNAWWDFRNYSVRGGDLSQRECELVILRVAVHMQTWYEWASHVDRGLAAGLSMDEINRVQSGPSSSEWSTSDALLLKTIDQLVIDRKIDDATQVALADHFSQRQVIDIVAIHGAYITLACMINTWDLQLDDDVRDRLPADLTRATFEQKLLAANRN